MEQSLARSNLSVAQLVAKLGTGGPAFAQSFNVALTSIATANRQVTLLSSKIQEAGRVFTQSLKFTTAQSAIRYLTGSIQQSIGWVKGLDSTMAQIATVTGKVGSELDGVYNSIVEGAADLRVAANDYANASVIFYQQGLNDSEVQRRTEITLQSAKAAGQSVETMASQLTAIWNSYRMVGEEQQRAAAVGAKLAASTAVEFKDIAEAMQISAAGASQMGVSYDSLAAIIATVGDTTQQSASVIGNAYKTIFSRFQQLTTEGTDGEVTLNSVSSKLQALGINVMDTAGKLTNLEEVIYNVGVGWKNYSEEQQLAIAQIVGGTRQYGQFLALMQNFPSYLKNLKLATEETGSTLIDQFLAARDTIEAAAENSREAWSRAFSELFEADSMKDLYKTVENLGDLIGDIIKSFGGWQGLIVQIGFLYQKNIADKIQDSYIAMKNVVKNLTPEMTRNTIRRENAEETSQLNSQIRASGVGFNDAEGMRAKLAAAQQIKTVMVDVNNLITRGNEESRQTGQSLATALANAQQRLIQSVDSITEMQNGYESLNNTIKQNLIVIESEVDMRQFLTQEQRAELSLLEERQRLLTEQVSAADLELQTATLEATISQQEIAREMNKLEIKREELQLELDIQREKANHSQAGSAENEAARIQIKILNNQLEGIERLVRGYQSSSKEITAALKNVSDAHSRLSEDLADVTRQVNAFNRAGGDIKDVAKQTQQVSSAFNQMAQDIGNAMKNSTTPSRDIAQAIGEMKTALESSNLPETVRMTFNNAFNELNLSQGANFSEITAKITAAIQAFNADPNNRIKIEFDTETFNRMGQEADRVAGALRTITDVSKQAEMAQKQMSQSVQGGIQNFTNMSMAILGLASGFDSLGNMIKDGNISFIGLLTVLTRILPAIKNLATSQGIATVATKLLKWAQDNQATSAIAAAIATQFLSETVDAATLGIMKIIKVIVAIVVAITAAITAVVKFNQHLREQRAETAESARMASQASKELSDTITGEAVAYEEAAKKAEEYADDKAKVAEAHEEMESAVQNIIDTLNESSDAVDQATAKELEHELQLARLTGQYDALTEAIKAKNQAQLEESITDAQISQDSAKAVFKDEMTKGKGNTWVYTDQYSAEFSSAKNSSVTDNSGQKKTASDVIKAGDYSHITETGRVHADKDDVNDWVKAYEEALALQKQLKEEGMAQTDYYEELTAWIDKSADSYAQIAEANDYINEQAMELLAIDPSSFVEKLNQGLSESDKLSDDVVQNLTIPEGGFGSFEEYETYEEQLLALADAGIIAKEAVEGFLLTNEDTAPFATIEDSIDTQVEELKKQQEALKAAGKESPLLEIDPEEYEKQLKEFYDGLDEEDKVLFVSVAPKIDPTDFANSAQEQLSKAKSLKLAADLKVKVNEEGAKYAEKQRIVDGLETGSTISADDFDKLGAGYEGFFKLMEDGTYQLIEDSELLANQIESNRQKMLMDGAVEVAKDAQQYKGTDNETYNTMMESANSAQQQLLASADSLRELNDLYATLQQEMEAVGVNGVSYTAFSQALIGLASQFDNTAQECEDYQMALRNGDEEQIKIAESALRAATIIGECAEKYDLNAKSLEIQARELKEANKEMDLSDEQAAHMAVTNQRLNKGIETLSKNWKEWSKELKKADKTSQDFSDTAADLSDAVADIVGWYDELSLSSKFIEDNFNLIEGAANGDTKAILSLGNAVAQEAVANAQLDESLVNVWQLFSDNNKLMLGVNTAFEEYWQSMALGTTAQEAFASAQAGVANGFNAIQQNLEGLMDESLSLDQVLGDPDKFVEQLNAYAAATGMTAEEMQKMLSSVGVTAKVTTDYVKQDIEVPTYSEYSIKDGESTFTYTGEDGEEHTTTRPRIRKFTVPEKPMKVSGYVGVAKIDMEGADGSSSGVPPIEFTGKAPPSTSAVSGGGSSGGGGSSPKKSNFKKQDNHKKSDPMEERYANIKSSIDKTTRAIEKLSDAADDAWGATRYRNLVAINRQLGIEAKKTQILLQEARDYLALDQSNLQGILSANGLGQAIFNSDGFLANKENIYAAINALQEPLDAAVQAAIDAYNAAGEGAAQEVLDSLSQQKEIAEKALSDFEENIKQKVLDAIDKVDNSAEEAYNAMKRLIESIREVMQNWVDMQNLKLELHVAINNQDIRTAEHLVDLWGDIGTRMGKTAEEYKKIFYSNKDNAEAAIANAKSMQEMIEGLKRGDNEAANWLKANYGDEAYNEWLNGNGKVPDVVVQQWEQAVEQMQDDRDAMQEALRNMMQEWTKYLELVMEDFDKLSEKLEHNKETLDMWGRVLEGMGLAQTVDGAKSMAKVVKTSYDTTLKQAHVLKEQAVTAKRANEDATQALQNFKNAHGGAMFDIENLTENEMIQYQEFMNWVEESDAALQETESAFKSKISELVDKMGEVLEAELTRLRAEFFDGIDGAFYDWDSMENLYGMKEDQQDMFLDDLTKNYELDKLTSQINDYIDESTNIDSMVEYQKLLDEINGLLESGVKINQTDLESLQAKFNLMQQMDAYEEAKNNKNTMRLQRDASGNYAYVYSGDGDASGAEDKTQKLKDALYEYEKLQQDAVDAMEDAWLETYAAIGKLDEQRMQAIAENDTKMVAYLDEQRLILTQNLDYYASEIQKRYDNIENFTTEYRNNDKTEFDWLQNHKEITFAESNLNILMGTQDTFTQMTGFHDHFKDYLETDFKVKIDEVRHKIVTTTLTDIETVGKGLDFMEGDYTDLANLVGQKSDDIIKDNAEVASSATELRNTATAAFDYMTKNLEANSNAMVSALNATTEAINQQIAALQRLRAEQLANIEDQGGEWSDTTDGDTDTVPPPSNNTPTNTTTNDTGRNNSKYVGYSFKTIGADKNGNGGIRHYYYGDGTEAGTLNRNTGEYTGDGRTIQDLINVGAESKNGIYWTTYPDSSKTHDSIERLKQQGILQSYTGGYFETPNITTIAEKGPELVLNAEDTKNILAAVQVMRQAVLSQFGSINGNLAGVANKVAGQAASMIQQAPQAVDQQVRIEANFPGVSVAGEIEEALNSLITQAAQYNIKK